MGKFWLTIILILHYCTAIHAAPSVEPCPNDSLLVADICKCDSSRCRKPPCLSTLKLIRNSTNLPGDCCPIYDCVDCKIDQLINGKCPCALGAILNEHNECVCQDRHKKLIDNECKCNPDQCELPHLCDNRSIPFIIKEGCCNITACLPCPDDSFVPLITKYNDTIEPKCVCYPCSEKQCGPNETVIIKQKGNDFPGNCCDIYECQPITTCKTDNNRHYKNGEKWLNDNLQKCECKNGIILCSEPPQDHNEEIFMNKSCYIKKDVYKHNETWVIDNGCTICRCYNGIKECIAHICDVNEMEIVKKRPLCTPLTKCNKTCPDGYKINRKGCEICKCNNNYNNSNNNNNTFITTPIIKYDDLLEEYNITKYELKVILEEYFAKRNNEIEKITSTTTSTTIPSTTTTTSTSSIAPIKSTNINNDSVITTTTVADLKNHTTALIWLASILSFILFIIIIVILLRQCVKTGSYNTNSQSKLKRYKIKRDDFFNNCLNNTYECKESMLKK